MKKKFVIILFFLISLFFQNFVFGQSENFEQPAKEEALEATIIRILEEKEIEAAGLKQLYQKLELQVTKGSLKDKLIIVEAGDIPLANLQKYKTGDRVLLNYGKDFEGNDIFYITDYLRTNSLFLLFFIFIIFVFLIGKWRGLASLAGMVFTFFIIFAFIMPSINAGVDPVEAAIFGALFIIPVSFYFSHGFNKKTTVAIVSTIISLIITGILAKVFIESAKLTGFSSEEASFLQAHKPDLINMKGLLLAGIIIGVLGVLDDVTVSQSAIVFQLKNTNPKIKMKELYHRAMNVGKDHIASMVNTLILVYTGAAMPLLLIFINNPHSITEIINYEIIADEIVRTLVGSIGLILAVPITTLIASLVAES